MKLAILLLCHKGVEQINLFFERLQNNDIEFFVHIDKKSNILDKIIHRPDIHVLPDELRIDVRWGEYSEIQATLNLMEYAHKKQQFDYYWLCSGQDFPIKSAETILRYFDKNNGRNFIQLIPSVNYHSKQENSYDKRNALYYPRNILGYRFTRRVFKRLYVEITGGYNHTFRMFKRNDGISKIKSYFGSQWICITDQFITWMFEYLKHNIWYETSFQHCSCPDESFFQTLFMLSPYKDTRSNYLHYINWPNAGSRNHPGILTMSDFEKIKSSGYLMARKFDMSVDSEIIKNLQNK